jgi:phosphate transport system substrate-binding protein
MFARLKIIGAAVAILATINPAAADVLRVGGTGAATEMMRRLAAMLADNELQVEVIPSLGTSGAIRALSDAVLDVAVSGRPLKPEEAARNLTQAAAVRTPFGLATSHRNPNGLKSVEIAEIFALGKARWADNSPIRAILRPRSDSDTALLGSLFPGMSAALEAARKRPDVPTGATDQDQDNADLAERVPGSLAGASLTQVMLEKRNLRFVVIDGVEPTLANFESGKYVYAKTMHFVISETPKPAVLRLIAFLKSPAGVRALREFYVLPAQD